jgi:hypothetical protein
MSLKSSIFVSDLVAVEKWFKNLFEGESLLILSAVFINFFGQGNVQFSGQIMTVALAHLSAKPMINLINFNNSWCAYPATVTHGFVEGCLLNNIHQLLFTNMEVADSKIVGSRCQSAEKRRIGKLRVWLAFVSRPSIIDRRTFRRKELHYPVRNWMLILSSLVRTS